jgi:hypothetical protein
MTTTATNAPGLPYADASTPVAGTQTWWDRCRARWDGWWYKPEAPLNLGVCRVLFFGAELVYHANVHFKDWGTVPGSLFQPVWIFERLHLPVLPTTGLLVAEVVWKLAMLCAFVGLFTRVATVVSAVGALYLLGVPFNYGKVYHLASIIIFTMSILAFSRCGDALSIDAWLRRRRGLASPAPSGEYRWPVRMVWVMMAALFFNAGMAKVLRGPVWTWITSENMAVLMTQRHYMNTNSMPVLTWGLFVAKHPTLYMTFAASSIAAEVFCFVALFLRNPLRLAVPLSLLAMQIGIGLMMRVWFTPYMVVYLFWVPWGDVILWARGRQGTSAEAVGTTA